MNLIALPAFADNYIRMLHDGAQAVVVDPGDAAPVHAALDEPGLALAGILVTHRPVDPSLCCDARDAAASALAQGAVGGEAPAVLTALREWKNRFR